MPSRFGSPQPKPIMNGDKGEDEGELAYEPIKTYRPEQLSLPWQERGQHDQASM